MRARSIGTQNPESSGGPSGCPGVGHPVDSSATKRPRKCNIVVMIIDPEVQHLLQGAVNTAVSYLHNPKIRKVYIAP